MAYHPKRKEMKKSKPNEVSLHLNGNSINTASLLDYCQWYHRAEKRATEGEHALSFCWGNIAEGRWDQCLTVQGYDKRRRSINRSI